MRPITILGITRWRFLLRCSEEETEFNHPFATVTEPSSTLSPRDEIAEGDISANLLETCRKRGGFSLSAKSTVARGLKGKKIDSRVSLRWLRKCL